MSSHAPNTHGPGPHSEQIAFARHNFDNLQSLIRASDAKAGAIVTLLIFLGATGVTVAKDAATHLSRATCFRAFLSTLFLAACLAFVLAFFRIVWLVQQVLRPRGARHYRNAQPGTDFMWQDHVIAHGTQDEYRKALATATPEMILHNLADQIFELSTISKAKMDALAAMRSGIWWAFASWVVVIGAGCALLKIVMVTNG